MSAEISPGCGTPSLLRSWKVKCANAWIRTLTIGAPSAAYTVRISMSWSVETAVPPSRPENRNLVVPPPVA